MIIYYLYIYNQSLTYRLKGLDFRCLLKDSQIINVDGIIKYLLLYMETIIKSNKIIGTLPPTSTEKTACRNLYIIVFSQIYFRTI